MVWIALDLEPFSIVRNRVLRFFFGKNFPQLTIPHESTLRKSYAAQVYDKVMDKVKSDLASVTTINLLFDGWTDRHHALHYMGLRWCVKIVTLSLKPCDGDADSISDHIRKELLQCIPDFDTKELFSTHDGAAAMKKTYRLLKVTDTTHCTAHALHLLLATDSMSKVAGITALLQKCKKIINTLHFITELLETELLATNDVLCYGPSRLS